MLQDHRYCLKYALTHPQKKTKIYIREVKQVSVHIYVLQDDPLCVSCLVCASADETILYYLVRFATIATLCHHHHHHETMILKLQSCCRCCSQLSEAASCRVCIYVCLQRGFFILCTFDYVSVFIFHTQYVVVKNIDLMFRISNFDFRSIYKCKAYLY